MVFVGRVSLRGELFSPERVGKRLWEGERKLFNEFAE